MTRDIFTPSVGTLDVIIYAVLRSLGLTPESLTSFPIDDTLDARCERNALVFLGTFSDRPIQGIKAIREVSGLGIRDAKEAWDQAIETYGDVRQHCIQQAQNCLSRGDVYGARHWLNKVE